MCHDSCYAMICYAMLLYSQAIVRQFQFVVRFDSSLLACTPNACGRFTPGAAWIAFGGNVKRAPSASRTTHWIFSDLLHVMYTC